MEEMLPTLETKVDSVFLIFKMNTRLYLIMDAIKESGHKGKINIGLDVASSEFFV